ncbi:TPA: cupin domain-containing protein [Candidatus Woesearchaeota archaeon]|nr:cupin domain-containing protein [Candidatus Woesearchaeota archaeon]
MKITKKSQCLHVDKPEGSSVDYYIFNEYEIHYNDIAPGTVQNWHHHSRIHEVLYIIDGEIEAHYVNDKGLKQKELVTKGDVVEVGNTPHTFINQSDVVVRMIVFRFVPTGTNQKEVIKNDKILDPQLD